MKNKTILIAETHKGQAAFIKEAIEKNKINITVMNIETNNSEDMKNAIIDYKPDIVFTNEVKSDRPATDVIKEIQSDISKFQPIFIINSGYSTNDIELLCCEKGIYAYSSTKPTNYEELATEIGKIANNKTSALHLHQYRNFSKENLDIVSTFMEKQSSNYIYNKEYKNINHELSQLHKELSKMPKKFRERFNKFEYLYEMNSLYENCFIYQYFNSKIHK